MIGAVAAALVTLAPLPPALAPAFPRAAFVPNPGGQEAVFAARRAGANEIWVIAGNKFGKSTIGGLCTATEALLAPPGGVVWSCCQDADVQREITQPRTLQFIAPHEFAVDARGERRWYRFRDRIDRMYLRVAGGESVVQFRNWAEDPESFEGPDVYFVHGDEITGGRPAHEAIYRGIRRSVVATGGWCLFTLTPVRGLTPLLKGVLDRFEAGEPGLAVVSGSSTENESNLPAGAIAELKRGRSDWEIEVRLHGRPLPFAGTPYVPIETIQAIRVAPPMRVEEIAGFQVAIFEEPDAGASYTVGGDAAEGVGRDRSALAVEAVGWERPCRIVAFAVGDRPPRALGEAMATLALRYRGRDRTALANPEANGPGLVAIETLIDRHIRIMPRPGAEDGAAPPARVGYLTGRRSREVLLDTFRSDLVAGGIEVRAAAIRDALMTFVWKPRRAEAAAGFHDDEVIAPALAHYAARTVPAPAASPIQVARGPARTPEEHFRQMRRRRLG